MNATESHAQRKKDARDAERTWSKHTAVLVGSRNVKARECRRGSRDEDLGPTAADVD